MTTETVSLEQIVADPRCQPRAMMDMVAIAEYAEAMREGTFFPPVRCKREGDTYYLYDGFHRLEAARQSERYDILVDAEPGSLEDAVIASCGVNADHGIRRTEGDKKAAILRLIDVMLERVDRGLPGWSQTAIAKMCGVNQSSVQRAVTDPTYATHKLENLKSVMAMGADGKPRPFFSEPRTQPLPEEVPSLPDANYVSSLDLFVDEYGNVQNPEQSYWCDPCDGDFLANEPFWHCHGCRKHWSLDLMACTFCGADRAAGVPDSQTAEDVDDPDVVAMFPEWAGEEREAIDQQLAARLVPPVGSVVDLNTGRPIEETDAEEPVERRGGPVLSREFQDRLIENSKRLGIYYEDPHPGDDQMVRLFSHIVNMNTDVLRYAPQDVAAAALRNRPEAAAGWLLNAARTIEWLTELAAAIDEDTRPGIRAVR